MINKYLTRVQASAPHRGLLPWARSCYCFLRCSYFFFFNASLSLLKQSEHLALQISLFPAKHSVHSTRLWWLEKNLDQGGGVGGGRKISTASAPTFLSSSILSSAVRAVSPGVSTPGSAATGGLSALAAAAV